MAATFSLNFDRISSKTFTKLFLTIRLQIYMKLLQNFFEKFLKFRGINILVIEFLTVFAHFFFHNNLCMVILRSSGFKQLLITTNRSGPNAVSLSAEIYVTEKVGKNNKNILGKFWKLYENFEVCRIILKKF